MSFSIGSCQGPLDRCRDAGTGDTENDASGVGMRCLGTGELDQVKEQHALRKRSVNDSKKVSYRTCEFRGVTKVSSTSGTRVAPSKQGEVWYVAGRSPQSVEPGRRDLISAPTDKNIPQYTIMLTTAPADAGIYGSGE